jgi:hypothetical protein
MEYLKNHVNPGNIRMEFDGLSAIPEQVERVGDDGKCPTTSLIVKLGKCLRATSVGVAGCRVGESVSAFHEQSAQPSIFTYTHFQMTIIIHILN